MVKTTAGLSWDWIFKVVEVIVKPVHVPLQSEDGAPSKSIPTAGIVGVLEQGITEQITTGTDEKATFCSSNGKFFLCLYLRGFQPGRWKVFVF